MSDKPKIYQGVRVKSTVKELLQKHRALQAQKTASTKSQVTAARDVCSPSTLTTHLDAFSGMQAQDNYFQTRPFNENTSIQMENIYDHHQMVPSMMPADSFSSFASSTPSHWSNGYLPSDSDFYGTTLVSRSPPDSFNLPSPVKYSSYSPTQSYSSSSSCYSSPSRVDLSASYSPENYHYQHCSLQHCFCLSHWSEAQEALATSDYAPYGSSDCLFSSSEDCYYRRDSSNHEMCFL